MTKKNSSDLFLDILDNTKFHKVSNWCSDNLAKKDYEFILINIYPFHYRVRFSCPKAHIMTLLGS